MERTTVDRTGSMCSECPFHLSRIQGLLNSCDNRHPGDCLEKIGQEFSTLNASATAYNRTIIMKYAQGMATIARYLDEQSTQGLAAADRQLLSEGIELGMRCKDDRETLCMEMQYDQICVLLDKVNARMQTAGKTAAA